MIKYLVVFMMYFLFIWFSPVIGAGIMDSLDMVTKTFKTLISADYIFGTGNHQLIVTAISSILLTCITFKEISA